MKHNQQGNSLEEYFARKLKETKEREKRDKELKERTLKTQSLKTKFGGYGN